MTGSYYGERIVFGGKSGESASISMSKDIGNMGPIGHHCGKQQFNARVG